jgi:hypothetical protein
MTAVLTEDAAEISSCPRLEHRPDLAQHRHHLLRLDDDEHDLRAADRLGVRRGGAHPEATREVAGACAMRGRHGDRARVGQTRLDHAADERSRRAGPRR